MALDDVFKAGRDYATISSILGSFRQDTTNPQTFQNFLTYSSQAGEPLTKRAIELMHNDLSKDPMKLREVMEHSKISDKRNLADVASKNYEEVVNALPRDALINSAVEIPDKDKNFYELNRQLERGDYEGAKRTYTETFDNRVWKTYIALADKEFIEKYAERYVEIQKEKFITKDRFTVEKTKTIEGKEVRVKEIDENKVKQYIKDSVEGYDKNEDREQAHFVLGQTYFASKMAYSHT